MVVDVSTYLTQYPHEIAVGGEDPEVVFDRYHVPDFVMRNDGIELDRTRLIAHVRPARRRARDVRVVVHETMTAQDRVAARYTLLADMVAGNTIATEGYMFGQLAADGRFQRIEQITRDVSTRVDREPSPAAEA